MENCDLDTLVVEDGQGEVTLDGVQAASTTFVFSVPSLRYLSLADNAFEDIDGLRPIHNMNRLKEIDFSGNPLSSTGTTATRDRSVSQWTSGDVRANEVSFCAD